jgi:hypothetical protein
MKNSKYLYLYFIAMAIFVGTLLINKFVSLPGWLVISLLSLALVIFGLHLGKSLKARKQMNSA